MLKCGGLVDQLCADFSFSNFVYIYFNMVALGDMLDNVDFVVKVVMA